MDFISNRWRLTRVVGGKQLDVDMAQLQTVMLRIQAELNSVPRAQREYVATALFELAVSKLQKSER